MTTMRAEAKASVIPLLDRLERRTDEIADRMLDAILRDIPTYNAAPPTLVADARAMVQGNVAQWFRIAREKQAPQPEELRVFTASAQERARIGVPLDALLHAYRLGARIGWEMLREAADPTDPRDQQDALEISGALMRYLDHVSTAVAQSYLEEREHLVTDEERRHRDLLDVLLEEGGVTEAVHVRAARSALDIADAYDVVLVSAECSDRAMRKLALSLRRWSIDPPPIVSSRRHETLMLVPKGSACEQVPGFIGGLRIEDDPVIAAHAGSNLSLGEALQEAETVTRIARSAGMRGYLRLEDMLPQAVAHQAGGRTTQILRDLIAPVRAHVDGQELLTTLRHYLESDGALARTASLLHVHKNTVTYRLRKIARLTGKNPTETSGAWILQAALYVS